MWWYPRWWYLEVGPLGRVRSWGWSPRQWDQCPYFKRKRHRVSPSLSALPVWGHRKRMAICTPERGSSPEPTQAGTLTLDFQLPALWEINVCCLSHPVFDSLLSQPELIKTGSQSQMKKVFEGEGVMSYINCCWWFREQGAALSSHFVTETHKDPGNTVHPGFLLSLRGSYKTPS